MSMTFRLMNLLFLKRLCTVLFPGTLFKLVHWLGMESNNCYCSWPLIWDNTESNNPRKANVLSRLVALTSHKVSHERLDTLSRAPNLISDSLVWCDTALATCLDTLRSYDGGCNNEWLGARTDLSDFFGWNFFSIQKCLNFCMCFPIYV